VAYERENPLGAATVFRFDREGGLCLDILSKIYGWPCLGPGRPGSVGNFPEPE